MVLPDKVKMVSPSFLFLGFSIYAKQFCPHSFKLEMKELYLFSELQLCGKFNWLNSFLPIPSQEMRHLFSLMEDPASHPSRLGFLRRLEIY